MSEQIIKLKKIAAPYGKEIEFQQVTYDNDFTMLRLQIREGRRFTTLDLDPDTAQKWLSLLQQWLNKP